MPIAHEFNPQLVLVSAGYDPALGCPEGEQKVSPIAFAHFTNMVNTVANGKVVALLEGGYFLTSLAEGAALTVKTLLGDPIPSLLDDLSEPCIEMKTAIKNAKATLRPYWKCIQIEPHDPDYKPLTDWRGPLGPPPTEFDPMCPTPPRPQQEDEEFEKQLKCMTEAANYGFSDVKVNGISKICLRVLHTTE